MVDIPSRYELGAAGLTGAAGVAGSFAVAGYTRSFVAAPIDAAVVTATPGPVVAFMIENVGAEAHLLHIGLALAIAVGLFGAAALGGVRVAERLDSRLAGGLLAGLAAWALAALLTRAPALALGAAVPVAVGAAAGPRRTPPELDASRRRALGSVAGAVAFLGAATGVGVLRSGTDPLGAAPGADGAEVRLQEAEERSLSVESDELPGLVSEIGNFYNVDIAEFEPELPAEEWSLTVTGETERGLTVDFADLLERPVEHRFVTLRCVGEDLNGRKLDTAVWTGTPIAPLLDAVDPEGECGCVVLRGEDGYFVEYPIEVLRDGFLAWGMNGKELPAQHGHPVRILAPGHWGETNVKWLTEVEVLDREVDGYWEQRGWEGTGPVNTVAKLWEEGVTQLEDGRVELAGHAYAGTRGVDAVEVSTDGGDTWVEATLSDPLPDEDVWRQWRHRFVPEGSHDVVVRAVDGTGTVQPGERSASFPSGASGWVRRTVGV
ncbi:molybdopterin-dependent oxidoreductase [Salinirussus salinus]|uniref:molybdopterin-dependent oxidoreductase n=1 Tax=Salinirussus salinus TaxID=1198300 RepID=UPI00135ADDEA|nr:molybdopterin-dependent oxidoreductase [Salinirussus salinus]